MEWELPSAIIITKVSPTFSSPAWGRAVFFAIPAEELSWTPRKFLCRYRSEEHTSELQSHLNLVCRLLLEKKKRKQICVSRLKVNRANDSQNRVCTFFIT